MTPGLFRVSAAGASVVMATASAFVVWLSVFDGPWLTYPVQPFPVLMQPVHAGEVVPLRVLRCNNGETTRTYIFSHSLVSVDKARPDVILPPITSSIAPGCATVESRVNIVPPGTAPGRYRIEGNTEINGNVRSFSVLWNSEVFEVVP